MKQTAVEFLHSEYKRIFGDVLVKPSQIMKMSDVLAKAKEMENQQKGYNEEEVVELNLRYLQELGKQQSENGHWINFKEWFEKFKNK